MQNPFVQTAIDLWEDLLLQGHRVTGVSGSDSKGVEDTPEEQERVGYGSSATAVYARNLSRPALTEALRAGHAYVRTLGVDDSPTVEVAVETPDGQRGMMGDRFVTETAAVTVTVTGGEGQVLLLSRNGDPAGVPVAIDTDPFVHTFTADRAGGEGPLGTFWRVDTQATSPTVVLTTIGNPIFLGDEVLGPAPGGSSGGRSDDVGGGGDGGRIPATGAAGGALLAGLAMLGGAVVVRRLRRAQHGDGVSQAGDAAAPVADG